MKAKKDKCYIYMRVSTSMQVEGYSLEAQKERLTKFADFQHMEIVREYCDAGKSGKNITGRPEFTQMLQDVANDRDGVKYILVFKLSRFGRNAADVLNSLQYIQDFGVNLICVEDGIDSSKDSGKLTITVLSAVAEIERENILVQTMEGRKQKAREGKWNGGQAPFGYNLDKENDTITIDPEDAEVVRIIFQKYVHEDMGLDSICNYLNKHGYTKKKTRAQENNYFTRTFLARILDNPVYVGKIAYGKSTTEKVKGTRDQYHRVKVDNPLIAEGKHDAIISDELWEAAQAKRKEMGVKWNKTHSLDHEHILSGIIKCPICGTGLAGTVRRRKNKKSGKYKDDFYADVEPGETATLYACWQGNSPKTAADWAIKIAQNNAFVYGTVGRNQCWYCGGAYQTYNCNSFCTAAYTHGMPVFKEGVTGSTKPTWWEGKGFTVIGQNIKTSDIKKGDIICVWRNSKKQWTHVMLAASSTKVVHAARFGTDPNSILVENLANRLKKYDKYVVLRYEK